jgi:hypothetical protein
MTTKLLIEEFEPNLAFLLPVTYELLQSSNLTVHPGVVRIILHGSRGLACGFRSDSDLDLSLLVDYPVVGLINPECYFKEIFETTLHHWHSPIDLDLAIVFDTRQCGLKCFDQQYWVEQSCTIGRADCFGLYKIQKGFQGMVENAGVQVKLMHPCLVIWEKMK